ncbi:hypothetical protein CLV78_11130 [Aliiruegeria haliotis]|uniref:Uncharacterized protein n=1 Tax=Aliiruegeria haliotis TaxID=1280846 RepID=A0A2T0RI38_9RHOB|nr:hypothetical protein CLV78_11130 [Aliiruegeria haliotis]
MPRPFSGHCPPGSTDCHISAQFSARFPLTPQVSVKVNKNIRAVLRENWCAFASRIRTKSGRRGSKPKIWWHPHDHPQAGDITRVRNAFVAVSWSIQTADFPTCRAARAMFPSGDWSFVVGAAQSAAEFSWFCQERVKPHGHPCAASAWWLTNSQAGRPGSTDPIAMLPELGSNCLTILSVRLEAATTMLGDSVR